MQNLLRPLNYLKELKTPPSNRPGSPRLLTYIVTYTCNARCIMCDSWKMNGKEDLTIPEIENTFKQLPKLDVVRLTGGEPFVRKDIAEIYKLSEEYLSPKFYQITTNGFLTRRIVNFLESRPRKKKLYLLISLDGTEKVHNYIRGKETAYENVIETLKELSKRHSELNVSLSINQTIVNKSGVSEYRKLRRITSKLKVQHQVVFAYETSATYSLDREIEIEQNSSDSYKTFGDFQRRDLESFFEMLEKDTKNMNFLNRVSKSYYIKGLKNRLLSNGRTPNPRCVALTKHLRIFPNGDIPTCQFNSKIAGNLRQNSFREIWFGQAARQQRDWVYKCPGCWAECEQLPNAIYTGDIIGEMAKGILDRVLPEKLSTQVQRPFCSLYQSLDRTLRPG